MPTPRSLSLDRAASALADVVAAWSPGPSRSRTTHKESTFTPKESLPTRRLKMTTITPIFTGVATISPNTQMLLPCPEAV